MNTTAAAVSDPSRLAAVGRELGLELTRIPRAAGVEHVAADPTTHCAHYVTALSCDCRRFCRSGACVHHSHLLDALGWLHRPEPHPTPCPTCQGSGLVAFAGVVDGRQAA